jgi:hypothetical protein
MLCRYPALQVVRCRAEKGLVTDHGHVERRHLPLITLATVAAAGTVWYMLPFQPGLAANLVVALALLALPLWRWLPAERYGRIAAAWTVGGLLGMYFFGTLVLAAGVVVALAAAARRYMRTVM